MSRVQTFAIAHEQDLILQKHEMYHKQCENLTWLLVGVDKSIDKLIERPDINFIHCEKYANNIEIQKELLHGTAMWLLYYNPELIHTNTSYIRFIEYDLTLDKNYGYYSEKSLRFDKEIYCHMEVPFRHCWDKPFYLNELNDKCLRAKYKTNLQAVTNLSKTGRWMCSINLIMKVDFFKKFFEFYLTFLDHYKGIAQNPNNLERLFTIYCLMNKIQWSVIPGAKHQFCNSHKLS